MKWLFAVLVALNIIVFGSMVAYRTQHKTVKPESALEGGTHELLRPSSLDAPKAEPQQASQPDWVVVESDGLIMAEPESEEAEALRKKQEAQQLKEKKEKMRREKEAQERRAAEEEMGAAGVERLCTSSATVVMDEDDYPPHQRPVGQMASCRQPQYRKTQRRIRWRDCFQNLPRGFACRRRHLRPA